MHRFENVKDEHPIIAIKGARVVDFVGKQLNFGEDAQLIFDIEHPRAIEIKQWYENLS